MILLVVLGLLTGVLLGLRFTVLILVPVLMLALILTISVDIAREIGFWWIVLDMFVVSTALQMGYLAGAALGLLRDAMDSMFDFAPESAAEPLRHDEQGLAWSKAG
jgi:hypothetical protein